MLNFHDEFTIFNNNIKLSESRKDQLRKSRNAVREKIKSYYSKELNLSQPKFRSQGSFTINTALNPLPDEEVDVDDGVYLSHVDDDPSSWPLPSEVHKDIIASLENHTQDGCESKKSCVRVLYKNVYHLDLPVYILKDNEALLGQTSNNVWIHSDAKAFKDWFYDNRENDQNSRVVRYLKAWRDYTKAPFTSIELTIEGINCFCSDDGNNHKAFLNTTKAIYDKLKDNRKIEKPVSPFENLWETLSDSQINQKIESFRILYEDLLSALGNKSYTRASSILREIFGDRFPWKKDEKEESVMEVTSGAKPWGVL